MKCCISFLILQIFYSVAQVQQDWVKRYNGTGNYNDQALAIAVDHLGNVYVTGHSFGNETGEDYVTIKYNPLGVQLWIAGYNGPGNGFDYAGSIAIDDSGNVFITGSSAGLGTGNDYATIKYNSSGIEQWVARYNGTLNESDGASSIAVDASGNVYVTGGSYWSFQTYFDYVTIKYNSAGVQQWVARYNGPGDFLDGASSIAIDASGNVYVTGSSYGAYGTTSSDYATIKYNPSGDSIWVRRYNGPGDSSDQAKAITVDNSGSSYITGESIGMGTDLDYASIKYNSAGVQQWIARYNGPGNFLDEASSIAVDGSGNVYITGSSYGGYGVSNDYATIKYNSTGVQQWIVRYNGPVDGYDAGSSIAVDGTGFIYVTGYSWGSGNNYDYATLKYNSSGIQQWLQRYNGPGIGSDLALSLEIDGSNNVYVTGYSPGNGTSDDYCTIKYSQPIGIQKISIEIPKSYSLSQNFPNPFNPLTRIRFDIPKSSLTKLVVFDILSREITSLVNEQLKQGTYEVEWDASNFSSGVYFYKLITETYTNTKRMVVIK